MDNSAYSFLELRRNLQSPRPTSGLQAPLKTTKGFDILRRQGTPSLAKASVKSNPPLRKSNQESENKKPLFNLLYGSQDKAKLGLHAGSATPQRNSVRQRSRITEHFDDGRSNESSQPRLDHLSSPFGTTPLGRPRSNTATSCNKDGPMDDATRHVFNSYITLKEECAQLKELHDSLQRDCDEIVQERDDARADVKTLGAQLAETVAQVADLRRAVAVSENRLSESQRNAEGADSSVREAQGAISALTMEISDERQKNERLRLEILKVKGGVQEIRDRFERRCSSYDELQEQHRALLAQVNDCKASAHDIRVSASEALEANKALVQGDGLVATIRNYKAAVGELQGQLESSKQVTNILRDKLYHLSSVVAESKSRIEELEEEKKMSLAQLHQDYDDLKARHELSATLQKKVEDLTDRLVVREMETFDYLATAVSTEERLEAANAELARLNAIISQYEGELTSLRMMKEDHLNKLLGAQEVTNAKDKELSVARCELKSANESKAELRALWLEAKKTIAEKDEELLKRNLTPELESQVESLNARLEAAQNELRELQEKYDKATLDVQGAHADLKVALARCSELERASEAQTRTLEDIKQVHSQAHDLMEKERVTVEERWQAKYAHLQELSGQERDAAEERFKQKYARLEEKVKTVEVQLAAAKGEVSRLESDLKAEQEKERAVIVANCDAVKYQMELSVQEAAAQMLEGEKRVVIETLDSLRKEHEALQTLLVEERERLKDELDSRVAVHQKLCEAHERRANNAEAALTSSERALERTQTQVSELTAEMSQMKLDFQEQTVALKKDEYLSSVQPMSEVQDLKADLDALVAENSRLKDDAAKLVERYSEGKLTDSEKSLVRHVLQVAESLTEEDLVQKDLEIRTRDNQLQLLQTRIKGLEKTLAQVLRTQTEGSASNMVNLQSLMSSSPRGQVSGDSTAPYTVSEGRSAATAMPPPRAGPSDPSKAANDVNPSLTRLMESSDDEFPLAERSIKKKRARMSSPPPAPPSAQSKRRAKNAPTTKRGTRNTGSAAADRKVSEDVGRSRALKRK